MYGRSVIRRARLVVASLATLLLLMGAAAAVVTHEDPPPPPPPASVDTDAVRAAVVGRSDAVPGVFPDLAILAASAEPAVADDPPPATTTPPPTATTTTTTTTSPPTTTTTPVPSDPSGSNILSEAQVRALVAAHFPASQVDKAVLVAKCESNFDANVRGGGNDRYVGLFQHADWVWDTRAASAGVAGRPWWDPEANVIVSAWLLGGGNWWHWSNCSSWADGQLAD